jgi:hypothetical protein
MYTTASKNSNNEPLYCKIINWVNAVFVYSALRPCSFFNIQQQSCACPWLIMLRKFEGESMNYRTLEYRNRKDKGNCYFISGQNTTNTADPTTCVTWSNLFTTLSLHFHEIIPVFQNTEYILTEALFHIAEWSKYIFLLRGWVNMNCIFKCVILSVQ